jgi:hypothetical protein
VLLCGAVRPAGEFRKPSVGRAIVASGIAASHGKLNPENVLLNPREPRQDDVTDEL